MKLKNIVFLLSLILLFSCSTTQVVDSGPEIREGVVSYLGPEGTYTEEATKLFFPSSMEFSPSASVQKSIENLNSGIADYAVIPIENTIGGPVYSYIDLLLENENLMIIGEVELPIRQALLAKEGTEVDEITTVYSHPQGIAQGKAWLEENIPKAEILEVSSTAEGARIVSESQEKWAAIASAAASDVYSLVVLEKGIQQNESNKTRFYIVAKENNRDKGERMVFSVRGKAKEILKALSKGDKLGLTLISLHDRNLKTELGEYEYLIECVPGDKVLYEKITQSLTSTRYLGSFDTL